MSLVLNIRGKDSSDADGGAHLEGTEVELLRLIRQVHIVLLEQISDIEADNHPPIRLNIQGNLEGVAIEILKLLINIAERNFHNSSVVYHVIKVHNSIFAVWLINQ